MLKSFFHKRRLIRSLEYLLYAAQKEMDYAESKLKIIFERREAAKEAAEQLAAQIPMAQNSPDRKAAQSAYDKKMNELTAIETDEMVPLKRDAEMLVRHIAESSAKLAYFRKNFTQQCAAQIPLNQAVDADHN